MTPDSPIPDGLPADVAHTAAEAVARVLNLCDTGAAVDRWLSLNELADCLRLRILAFGKASAPMARAAMARLEGRVDKAVVLTPPELAGLVRHPLAEVHPVDHPTPTERNVAAARALAACAMEADPRDGVLVLMSGGGSAHLTLPRSGVTLEDVRRVTSAMLLAGAPITDLNTVRRSMEQLKGGGLRAVCPADRVYGLIVSDVIGDDPAVVASGPLNTVPPADPGPVLEKWGVSVEPRLLGAMRAARSPSVRPPATVSVLFSGRAVADALPAELAKPPSFAARPLRVGEVVTPVEGEAAPAGAALAARLTDLPAKRGNAVLAWGETTVRVGSATGLGGRNLELALSAARSLPTDRPWALLTLATDGVDGPTDAAGAVLCSEMFARPGASALAAAALDRHDSYHAVEMLGGLLRTGPTGTNVNDFALLWWRDL